MANTIFNNIEFLMNLSTPILTNYEKDKLVLKILNHEINENHLNDMNSNIDNLNESISFNERKINSSLKWEEELQNKKSQGLINELEWNSKWVSKIIKEHQWREDWEQQIQELKNQIEILNDLITF